MPAMGRTDGRNVASVPRCSEPVVDRGPDGAPPDRMIARALVPGDQKQQALPP